jgi:hypothetical protein
MSFCLLTSERNCSGLQLHSPLRRTLLDPSANLTHLSIPLRPRASRLQTQTGRSDTLPANRIMHSLTLTYRLKLLEGGSISPVFKTLQHRVYDGPFEGHVWALYNSNKRQLCYGNVTNRATKVPKGVHSVCSHNCQCCSCKIYISMQQ